MTKRERAREASRRYRARHPERMKRGSPAWQTLRAWQLKRTYGLTVEQFESMERAQGGLCALCGHPQTAAPGKPIRHLSVDHDHETGKVRALLCNRCNRAIGLFDDDPEMLLRAVMYLRRFQ